MAKSKDHWEKLTDTAPELASYIPTQNPRYVFDDKLTNYILTAIRHNRNLLTYGMHGSGKSTHIEQIAARLNWPCLRINLDGHISRLELIGRDVIKLENGKQITEFQLGLIPWALSQGVILILDEYDAARPETLFIIQRLLENENKFVLAEKNLVITPHKNFRLFATANTIGTGDYYGIYHGTNMLNQAQLDRWQMVVKFDYPEKELEIITSYGKKQDQNLIKQMIDFAHLIRRAFQQGEISITLSLRNLITWLENYYIFDDFEIALQISFLDRLLPEEIALVLEFYQRCFAKEYGK